MASLRTILNKSGDVDTLELVSVIGTAARAATEYRECNATTT